MNIAENIKLIRDRNESGLSALYNKYSGALNGIITRIVGSEKVAEEVLQQTFLKIWEKIYQFDETKSTLFTWMASIARNSAIDKVRLKKFQNEQLINSWELKHIDSQIITTKSSNIGTTNLLSKLEPKYKEVLDCIYLQGYSQSQAAKLLNIPLGTIKRRISIGIKQIREELSEEISLFMGVFIFLIYLYVPQCL